MRKRIASVLIIALLLTACIPQRADNEAPAVPESASRPPKATKPAAQEFSAIAFLDESLYVQSSELFYSPDGRMLKQATYFAGTDRVLALVTRYDAALPEGRAGTLYLVDSQDASQVFQLKGGKTVLDFLKAPDGSVYYHALEEKKPEEGEEAQDEVMLGRGAARDVVIVLHRLDADGEDTNVPVEGALVERITEDGKLLLAHTSKVTPFGGYYMRGLTTRWSLYDVKADEEVYEFDYSPLLSPDLSIALDVVRNYDASDYEKSYFALYQGTPEQPAAELRLVYSCPYFITLEADRWEPVIDFVDDASVLLSRFIPSEDAAGEEASVPHVQGKLSLELFDLTNHSLKAVLTDVAPHLDVICHPGEPVFFYSSYTVVGVNRVHSVSAVALDGSKTRVLWQNDIARRIRLMDLDAAAGKILLVEDYETGAGNYSLMRELALSATSLPQPEETEEEEEEEEGEPPVEPPERSGDAGPPPIMLPGERI